MKNAPLNSTPPPDFEAPIVHKIRNLHKLLYRISLKLPKNDKLGIYNKIEQFMIEILSLSIEASLAPRNNKKVILEKMRVKIEVVKHLIRSSCEIHVINEKTYLVIQELLQEISKMANGWIKYMETQNPPN